jgi:hypothetical protein
MFKSDEVLPRAKARDRVLKWPPALAAFLRYPGCPHVDFKTEESDGVVVDRLVTLLALEGKHADANKNEQNQ